MCNNFLFETQYTEIIGSTEEEASKNSGRLWRASSNRPRSSFLDPSMDDGKRLRSLSSLRQQSFADIFWGPCRKFASRVCFKDRQSKERFFKHFDFPQNTKAIGGKSELKLRSILMKNRPPPFQSRYLSAIGENDAHMLRLLAGKPK